MSGFIEGENRYQVTLFPERLDDYIGEDSAVRVIDVFIDRLDLSGLGFRTQPNDTGRPGYHPAMMLKLFIYGYLNRVQSSRRLEREAQRNVELMWLTGRLAPDFKTIADFRKDNGEAIRLVCREFVMLCRKLNMFADAFVAIDGSKFKAVNHRDRNLTKAKMRRRLQEIDKTIERYLGEVERADRQETTAARGKGERLTDKIAALEKEMDRLKELEVRLQEAPDRQISFTDPDARSMKSRGTGVVGYNVQLTADVKHHLVVDHQVTNDGSDRGHLSRMAHRAKETIGTEVLDVVADRGYYNGDEIRSCELANIKTYVPKPQTSSSSSRGMFDKRDFTYDSAVDEYVCPAGDRMIYRYTSTEAGKEIRRYWGSACSTCSIKSKCTSGEYRRMRRWEHEEVLESMQSRLDAEPERMRARRETIEHPFGTFKSWMGSSHFQMRTLPNVSTEMSLHVLAYNLKRMMNILGIPALMEAIQA